MSFNPYLLQSSIEEPFSHFHSIHRSKKISKLVFLRVIFGKEDEVEHFRRSVGNLHINLFDKLRIRVCIIEKDGSSQALCICRSFCMVKVCCSVFCVFDEMRKVVCAALRYNVCAVSAFFVHVVPPKFKVLSGTSPISVLLTLDGQPEIYDEAVSCGRCTAPFKPASQGSIRIIRCQNDECALLVSLCFVTTT